MLKDIKKPVVLEAGQKFKVKEIELVTNKNKNSFVVHFSDILSRNQNPAGFVKITPALETQLKSIGTKLYILGDFVYEQEYKVEILPGIKNRWEQGLKKGHSTNIELKDIKPSISFVSPGVFLPTENNYQLNFETINVREVKLEVKKVYANNLCHFMQGAKLKSNYNKKTLMPDDYFFRRVGTTIHEETLYLGEEKNKKLVHALDLKKIISQDKAGLFIIKIHFNSEGILYQNNNETQEIEDNHWWADDYYTNPYKIGYLRKHGIAVTQVVVSDIGMTVKIVNKEYMVFTHHLKTTQPLSGVEIKLINYQNQVIASGVTNNKGIVKLTGVEEVFYVEGSLRQQRSIVNLNEMRWNLAGFDVEGVSEGVEKNRAFIYTDRGVYRPGDDIHLSVILRNHAGTFPKNHPVTIKFFNPKNQMLVEKTSRQAKDGFYYFLLKTQTTDITGNWRVELLAGEATFNQKIRVETVVPNRLKVNIITDPEVVGSEDDKIDIKINSKYLFGTPAADLKVKVDGELLNLNKTFTKFSKFQFNHQGIAYQPYSEKISVDNLNAQGEIKTKWKLPVMKEVPSGLVAKITAKVFEKGGRFTRQKKVIPVNPYPYYVGIKPMEAEGRYVRIPKDYEAEIVLVDNQGEAVAGEILQYRLYRNENWWWWEYRDESNWHLKFKKHKSTDLFKEGNLVTKNSPTKIKIPLEEKGEYLLEVQAGKHGHTAGCFFIAMRWGSEISNQEDAGEVVIKTDKQKYFPGEKALVSFQVPGQGHVLFTLERGKEVLDTWGVDLKQGQKECTYQIPITKAMLPTAYVSVSIFQPHIQTKNDLPLRLYGVVPLPVEDPKTRWDLKIKMQDEIKPNEKFSLELQSEDKKTYQATVAVTDVGLLDLTAFKTPNPWNFFFQKMRLGVLTSDLYAYVIGANKSDIAKLFSIGGGELLRKEKNLVKAKRFKPVAMFQGPLTSDQTGKLKIEFKMPNYIGAVRVMAVAARKNSYGSTEKEVVVRKPLMLQPTLPRVLGPDEAFKLPVSVMAMREDIGEVKVEITTTGPLIIEDSQTKVINFSKAGDQMLYFKAKTKKAVGVVDITITGKANKYSSESKTQIAVRPSAPSISTSQTKTIKPGEKAKFTIPDQGILGSNQASISVKSLPDVGIYKRLKWLIKYPYGCIEQTTSAVFPQLYLKMFLADDNKKNKKIDKNIQAGIDRLKKFVLPSGGFSYWPGGRRSDSWSTNYAGHFLLEAKEKGYNVPEEILENWKKFQHSQALKSVGKLKERVYRLYLLAKANKPALGPMNLLKENRLSDMDDTEKWILAAAYQLAGSYKIAKEIHSQAGYKVKDYQECGGTYGSGIRDRAMILEALVLFQKKYKAAELFENLGKVLASNSWHSTQTIAYTLLAMGKHLQDIGYGEETPRLVGKIILPNGKSLPFDSQASLVRQIINQGFGKRVEVEIAPQTSLKTVYATLNWSGVPLTTENNTVIKDRLSLKIVWKDEDGDKLDVAKVKQSESFYGEITVERDKFWENILLENIALVQIMPSGWEIENLRLSNEVLPTWINKNSLTQADYVDIRDDRIMWFFEIKKNAKKSKFVFKVNAITAGKFFLPATKVEAMYDNAYKATTQGQRVEVIANQ